MQKKERGLFFKPPKITTLRIVGDSRVPRPRFGRAGVFLSCIARCPTRHWFFERVADPFICCRR
jgi:hypothetical protein